MVSEKEKERRKYRVTFWRAILPEMLGQIFEKALLKQTR
jgi:hypothetical protein